MQGIAEVRCTSCLHILLEYITGPPMTHCCSLHCSLSSPSPSPSHPPAGRRLVEEGCLSADDPLGDDARPQPSQRPRRASRICGRSGATVETATAERPLLWTRPRECLPATTNDGANCAQPGFSCLLLLCLLSHPVLGRGSKGMVAGPCPAAPAPAAAPAEAVAQRSAIPRCLCSLALSH